jgi:hypothetical protein
MQKTPTERAEARRIELDRRISKAPMVEIVGVIDASGSGGVKYQGDRQWRFVANLCAWRCNGGPVRTQPVRLERFVSEGALAAANRRAQAWKTFRCRARLLDAGLDGGPRALAVRVLPTKGRDTEMEALRKALQVPLYRRVPGIGRVVLDRRSDFWTGRTKWVRSKVLVNLRGDPKNYQKAQLRATGSVIAKAGSWDTRLKRQAAKELLSLKNKSWRRDAEIAVSSKDFQQRLTLECWTMFADGSMEFSFDDGDLFFGHEIVISVDPKGRLGKPELHG